MAKIKRKILLAALDEAAARLVAMEALVQIERDEAKRALAGLNDKLNRAASRIVELEDSLALAGEALLRRQRRKGTK